MMDFQLIIIGAGPGGYSAALRAAQMGLKTAIVESREIGGTCLHRGCIPTKTLLHVSEVYHDACHGEEIGIRFDGVQVDMEKIFSYKRSVSETLASGVETMLSKGKVAILRGHGIITAADTVEITRGESAGVYTADRILVATGSQPFRPSIPGLDLPGVITSDELLEGTDHLYSSIVIIGGGVIGVEFATFYADLGCEVTVIEGKDRLLSTFDRELGQNLANGLKRQGVHVHLKSMVQSVEKTADGMTVHFEGKNGEESVSGEVVLCAIGRVPYHNELFSDHLNPEMDGRSLHVNERFETSIPGIYAIGDVSSRYQLAHVAAAQGKACVEMMCGRESLTDLSLVPSCIYSHPEIATVGMTDAQAKEAGIPVKVGKCVMGGNARTLLADAGRSFMKVVAHAETGAILGAHMMCINSTDMISQMSAAIEGKKTPQELLQTMRPHPTFEEALTDALEDLCRKLEK
ncbi:MAG: dihydrolipoyl dehydrogenase [Firmicutes bacterium]|nr:dihydrolipoyl dehydrogenase [Bacillota bacterium]